MQDVQKKVLSALAWGEIAVVAVGGFLLMLPVFAATRPFDRNRRIAGRMLRDVGIVAARLHPLWRFQLHGDRRPELPQGNTVVVSNHASQADPFFISLLPWEMKWLTKIEIYRMPVVGWMQQMAGDIPVHRGQRESARTAMDVCATYLKNDMPVMIFPEGTRSKDGNLLPFKDGAFRLAIENQSMILPIAIAGTERALPKHSWVFGRSRSRIAVGEPIDTRGMTLDDMPQLKAETRTRIEALLEEIRPITTAA